MTDLKWVNACGNQVTEVLHAVNESKGTATYYVAWPCGRCGGLGGGQQWAFTGWTCYECGGHGYRTRMKALKAYTTEAYAKLTLAREKRAAVKAAKNAVIAAERAKIASVRLAAWRVENTALVAALDAYAGSNPFIIDLRDKLVEYGTLSVKQVDALTASLQREAIKVLAHDCPVGRVRVEGDIVTVKVQESKFGFVTKMLVTAHDGYKVWMTAPKSLVNPAKGMHVIVTVTVEPSGDDKKFGFGSRPVLEAA
jgi:hypothetical protein